MSGGNSKKSETKGESDFGFEYKWHLKWMSGGDIQYGTKRVSEIRFDRKWHPSWMSEGDSKKPEAQGVSEIGFVRK